MIQSEIKKIKSENEDIDKKINQINLSMFDVEDVLTKQKLYIENLNTFKATIDLIEDVETKRKLIMNLIEYFTYDSEKNEVGYKARL